MIPPQLDPRCSKEDGSWQTSPSPPSLPALTRLCRQGSLSCLPPHSSSFPGGPGAGPKMEPPRKKASSSPGY